MPANPRVWNRKLHRWAAIACLLPLLVVVSTGLLLQIKKNWSWVQPSETRGGEGPPRVDLDSVLETCKRLPDVDIDGWTDVERLDLRPAKGMLKVVAKSRWEVQLDATSGSVLQVAYRRTDLIESLHDGSWFHPGARTWVFLPNGLLAFGLIVTGAYLWALPFVKRLTKRVGKRSEVVSEIRQLDGVSST